MLCTLLHSDSDTALASYRSDWWEPHSPYYSMSNYPPLSPNASSRRRVTQPPHSSHPLASEPAQSSPGQFSFLNLSPPSSPPPTEQPASSPPPPPDVASSSTWSLIQRPPMPQRSESLPDWITGLPSPVMSEPQQPPSMSPLLSAALFAPLPPPLQTEAVSAWSGFTTASFSTSISHMSSSAPSISTMFAAPQLSSSGMQLLRTSSSSSLTSSSDSSPASSSPSGATSSSYPSGLTPRRRYQRLTGLSLEQRMERRRQSHRELDAVRRHREALAISRLEQLTAHRQRTHSLPQQHSRAFTYTAEEAVVSQAEEEMETDEKGKRHRTAVLENSVERLEELQQLVNQLTTTCTQQTRDIATLRLQLQSLGHLPLPPPQPPTPTTASSTSSQPAAHHGQAVSAANLRRVVSGFGAVSLYSTLFTSVSVGVLVVECGGGVVVDVNERLLQGGYCTREDIIGRQVVAGYHTITSFSEWDSQPAGESAAGRMLVRGQPAMVLSQYGATKENVLALYCGQVDQIHVVWRAQLGDGLAYELPLSSFVASRDEADGGRPRTVVVTLSLSEAKRL